MPPTNHSGPLDAKVAELLGILLQIGQLVPAIAYWDQAERLQILKLQQQFKESISLITALCNEITANRKMGNYL